MAQTNNNHKRKSLLNPGAFTAATSYNQDQWDVILEAVSRMDNLTDNQLGLEYTENTAAVEPQLTSLWIVSVFDFVMFTL